MYVDNFYQTILILIPMVYLFSRILIRELLGVMKKLNIYDIPNTRSAHANKVPLGAGFSFFIIYTILLVIAYRYDESSTCIALLTSLSFVVMIGTYDDLIDLSPLHKYLLLFAVACSMLYINELAITNLNGWLGIELLPWWGGISLSIFVILSITNAFNMVDGIDGLSAFLGIFYMLVFGYFFYMLDNRVLSFLCILSIPMLIAYLRYNFSNEHKFFMGDTGSLLLGFFFSFLALHLLSISHREALQIIQIKPENIPVISVSILSIPILDTLRIMGVRLLKGRSPFKADANHLHHVLTKYWFSHKTSSILLTLINISIFLTVYLAEPHFYSEGLTLIFCLLMAGWLLFFWVINKNMAARKLKLLIKKVIVLDFQFIISRLWKRLKKEV